MDRATTSPASENERPIAVKCATSKILAILLLNLWATTTFCAASTSQSSNNPFAQLLLQREQRTLSSSNRVESDDHYPDHNILKLLTPSVVEGTWARKVPASHAAAASAAAAAAAAIRLSRRQSEQLPNGRVRPEEPPEPDCKTLRAMWRTMRRMNRHSELNNDIPQLPNFIPRGRSNPFTLSIVPGRQSGSGKSKSPRRRVMVKNPSFGGSDFFTDAIIVDPDNAYSKWVGRGGKVYLKPGYGFESGHPVIITDAGSGFDLSGFGAFPEELSGGFGSKNRGRKPDYVVHHVPLRNPPPPGQFMDNPLSPTSLGGDFGTVVNSPEERALFKSAKFDSRKVYRGSGSSRRTGDYRKETGKMILPGDGVGVFGNFGELDDGHVSGHDTEHGVIKTGGERGRKDTFFGSMVGQQHMDSNPGPFAVGSTRYSRGGKDESCARLKFKRCKSDPDCDCAGSRLHCSFTSLPIPGGVRYGKCVPFALQSKKVDGDDWGKWQSSPLDPSQLGMSNFGPRLRRTSAGFSLTNYEPPNSPEETVEQIEPFQENQEEIKLMNMRLRDLAQRVQELPQDIWQISNSDEDSQSETGFL